MKNNDHWLFYGLIALILWAPIPFGSNRAWAWSILELATYGLFLAWYIPYGKQLNLNYLKPYRPLISILAIVQIWTLVQLIPLPLPVLEIIAPNIHAAYENVGVKTGALSLDPARSQMQLLKGLSYLILVFLTLVLVNSRRRLTLLLYSLLLSGVLQALYGSFFVMTNMSPIFFTDNRSAGLATGTFIYRNHFANFLMMCLSVGIGLLVASLSSNRQKTMKRNISHMIEVLFSPKALMRISLIIMVIALVLSRSRMGNTAFFAALSLVSIFALVFMKQKTRALLWLFASMLVIDILIVSNYFGLEKVRQRLEQTSVETETRDEVLVYGLELVKQHPLTGTGNGSFISSFPSVKGPGVNLFYDFAHNEYLQFTIELGIPMTLLLGLLLGWSLWHAQYALRQRNSNLMRGLGFAAMMAILGQMIHMTVDFTLQPPANAIYFLVLITLGWMSRFARFIPNQNHPVKH